MNSLCLAQDDVYHPVSQAYPAISPPSFPCRPGSLIHVDCRSEGSLTENRYVGRWTKGKLSKSRQRRVTIDVLPDDVLLEIFDCYCYIYEYEKEDPRPYANAWLALVHVSRNWRCLVFDSPRRLNLRLVCSERTPVREMLVIWPPLPIIIRCGPSAWDENGDNIIAALEHHNRVCNIYLPLDGPPSLHREKLLVAMEASFPALESLSIWNWDATLPLVSGLFLGGSAPHLRYLSLMGIPFPFPELRKLLLSATDLVTLSLSDIPHSGYFSPEAIVTCLSALTRLEKVEIEFKSPRSRPSRENRPPPPPTRTLLPALHSLIFTGVSEYLEDLVARIDAPLLDKLKMSFFHQLIFDTPQLDQFISCNSHTQTDVVPKQAHVVFRSCGVALSLLHQHLYISCSQPDWQLSALEQVCGLSLPQSSIPKVENLSIFEIEELQLHWQDNIDNGQWLELLHPFIAVKKLFLSRKFAPLIASALQELVGGRAYEVLPVLQSIHLEGFHPSEVIPKEIGQFIGARHLSAHPIVVVPARNEWWSRESYG